MRTVKVTFTNGDKITTGINGTEEEIRTYYQIGRIFNLATGGDDIEDDMQKVVAIEFLD